MWFSFHIIIITVLMVTVQCSLFISSSFDFDTALSFHVYWLVYLPHCQISFNITILIPFGHLQATALAEKAVAVRPEFYHFKIIIIKFPFPFSAHVRISWFLVITVTTNTTIPRVVNDYQYVYVYVYLYFIIIMPLALGLSSPSILFTYIFIYIYM